MSFQKQVLAFQRQAEARLEAVVKESVQELLQTVQKPRDKGGRMPVDTGFLRNSGAMALNSTPTGSIEPPILVINRAKIGDRLVFGWTANYAVYMEARYAFLRMAVQDWNQIVFRAVKRVGE